MRYAVVCGNFASKCSLCRRIFVSKENKVRRRLRGWEGKVAPLLDGEGGGLGLRQREREGEATTQKNTQQSKLPMTI